jgi:hypothetical protein
LARKTSTAFAIMPTSSRRCAEGITTSRAPSDSNFMTRVMRAIGRTTPSAMNSTPPTTTSSTIPATLQTIATKTDSLRAADASLSALKRLASATISSITARCRA